MGLNNMGVGFNFTGRDSGLGKAIGSVKAGFSGLAGAAGSAVKGVMSLSAQALTNRSSFSAAAGEMRVTTTGIEAFGVAADQTASKVFAGMGNMTMGIKKAKSMVTGLAYGMNRDAGSIAESLKAVEQQGIDVTKVGFKSFGEFSKFADVANLDTKAWAATMGHLKKEVGFSDKELEDLNKTTVALGTRFNMGTEAMGNMVNMTKLMQDESQGLFITWGKDKTRDFLNSGTALAGMFMKAGHSSEEAAQLAQGLTKTVVAGANNFQSIYSGLETNLGPMSEAVAQNLGGVQNAFELLQKSPLEFAQKVNQAFVSVEKSGKVAPADLQKAFARFSQQLSGSTSPAIADFITHGMTPLQGQVASLQAELSSPKGLGGKNGSLTKIAQGFRSGLTATDEYNRILDQFQTRLKHTAGVNDNEFNKSVRDSGVAMTDTIKGMKKEMPGFGKLFDTMVEVQNHGFGGLLGKLDKTSLAMNMLSKNMGPVGAGVIQLGTMFYQAGQKGNNFGTRMAGIQAKLGEFGKVAGDVVNETIKGFNLLWPQMKEAGGKAVMSLYNALYADDPAHSPEEALKKLWTNATAYLREALPRWWDGFKGLLLNLYKGLSGDDSVKTLGDAFSRLWDKVKPVILNMLKGVLDEVMELLAKAAGVMWTKIKDKFTPDFVKYGSLTKKEGAVMQSTEDFSTPARSPAFNYAPAVGAPPMTAAPSGSSKVTTKPAQAQSATTKALSDAIHNPEWVSSIQGALDGQTTVLKNGFDGLMGALGRGQAAGGGSSRPSGIPTGGGGPGVIGGH